MKGIRNKVYNEAGQSLVEFSVVLVVLLILLAGVLDIGRVFYTFVGLENGAGEGAMFAAIHPRWITADDAQEGGSDNPAIENITYRVTHESPSGLIDWDMATIGVITTTIEAGQPITVTVTYPYSVMTPFVSKIVNGGVMPIQARSTQVILNTDD